MIPAKTTRRVVSLTSLVLLTAGLAASVDPTIDEARSSVSRCSVAKCAPCETKPGGRRLHLPARLPRREIAVPILMYHRINVPPPTASPITRGLTVHPADFARQMKWLKRNGYRTVTQRQLFSALLRERQLGRKPIMITFDDGYRDAFHKAAPVLSRLGMRATAYVISRRIVNARVERLARRAGYVLAVTTQASALHSARRPLALRRLRVLDSTGVRGLAALLGGS